MKRITRRLSICLLLVLVAGTGHAQTLTPRTLGHVAAVHKSTEDKTGGGVGLLSQADIEVDNDTTQIGLQALDLFFTQEWRLYVRSTLPVPKDEDSASLDDAAIAAVMDPYGGVLNLSAGYFSPLKAKGEQGLFFDARLGLKLVALPEQSGTAPTVLNTKVTPFYSGTAILKFVHPLFNDAVADDEHAAGGFEFGFGYLFNVTADDSASKVFTNGMLDKATHALRFDVAVSLTKVAAIDLSWTPWSSQDFGKRFVIGIKLLNPKPAVE